MPSYQLKIQYDGSSYSGWQIQKQGEVTIQGELNRCLKEMCRGEEIRSLGSGRTDAGVHALGQVAKVDIPVDIPLQGVHKGLNSILPKDIRILEVNESPVDFHPIYSAKKKEYRYFFCEQGETNPLTRFRYADAPPLIQIDLVREALTLFVGKHDFKGFQTVGTPVESTVREIFKAELQIREADEWFPKRYEIIIEGSGFLKQMMRLIVGTVWEYARGKINLKQIRKSLETGGEGHLGPVAQASGLYLWKVTY